MKLKDIKALLVDTYGEHCLDLIEEFLEDNELPETQIELSAFVDACADYIDEINGED